MRTTPNNAEVQRTVRAVADLLERARVDEIVTHDNIRALIPHSLEYLQHYIFVARAAALLNREGGAVFATVNREGYRRLSHIDGAIYAGRRGLYRIRHTARTARKRATNAIQRANSAPPAERRRAFQQIATLGIIEHLTLSRTVDSMPDEPEAAQPDPLGGLRAALGR